ncbi:hypothetical protein PRCB_01240 [Pantoea rodasii]|uniref:Uncharacterized protein n=1 Tax=Pantoea rodasii TaxID=1076549 RepID=A0A2M9WII3_9GAMM|nr:hypothetical protein [Pantoea rodasii]ORM64193.1 hypothetical protein HA45_10150 [Pantoea rodasii]PJZ07319.1 hypothetical protein PRCB_01240 [Pantoea rodasii]
MNPWGPIIAAMIAGFIAFIGMIITKENKVSEFRQAWINEFREEISFLIESYKKWVYNDKNYETHLSISRMYLADPESAKNHREQSKVYEIAISEARNEIERYTGRIKLRLNSDINRRRVAEKELDSLIDNLLKTKDIKSAEILSDKIYLNSSLILSTEWKVVKKGEESYIKSKKFLHYVAIFVSAIVLISFCFHLEDAMKWLMNSPPPLLID